MFKFNNSKEVEKENIYLKRRIEELEKERLELIRNFAKSIKIENHYANNDINLIENIKFLNIISEKFSKCYQLSKKDNLNYLFNLIHKLFNNNLSIEDKKRIFDLK